jgi:hypothetical protein
MSLSSNRNEGSMERLLIDDDKELEEKNDEKQESDSKVIV